MTNDKEKKQLLASENMMRLMTIKQYNLCKKIFFLLFLSVFFNQLTFSDNSLRLSCTPINSQSSQKKANLLLNCKPVTMNSDKNIKPNKPKEITVKSDKKSTENKIFGEEPPEDISRLFLRESEVLLKPKEIQISIGFNYSKNDNFYNLRLNRGRYISIPLSISVGLTDNMEIFTAVPFQYIEEEFVSFGDAIKNENYGPGDLSVGFSYKLLDETQGYPSLTSSLRVITPTGEEEDFNDPNSIALGSGFWGTTIGLSITKSIDPAVVFFSLGYTHTFGEDDIKPGSSFSYGFGTGLSINSSVSLSGRFFGVYNREAQVDGEKILGSSSEPLSFNIGATYQLNNKHRIESNVDFGLNDDANDASISLFYIVNL